MHRVIFFILPSLRNKLRANAVELNGFLVYGEWTDFVVNSGFRLGQTLSLLRSPYYGKDTNCHHGEMSLEIIWTKVALAVGPRPLTLFWNLLSCPFKSYSYLAQYVSLYGPFYNQRYLLPLPCSISHTLSFSVSPLSCSLPLPCFSI
jgi:hypothetical protein